MYAKDSIELDYSTLGEGETVAGELCPFCKGGTTGEHTLSVSRRDGVLYWNCHRSSCPFRGASSRAGRGQTATQTVQTRGAVGRMLVRESEPIPAELREYIRDRYGITGRHAALYGLGWIEDRLSLPVQDLQGNVVGVNLRSLTGATPKAKLHTEDGAIAWYVNHTSPDVIIVEDQLSAIRASDFLTSVALLGTNLNEERAYEIKSGCSGNCYLALDADAWNKAVQYAIKFRSLLGLRLLKLDKDIKDMTNEELASFMSANVST